MISLFVEGALEGRARRLSRGAPSEREPPRGRREFVSRRKKERKKERRYLRAALRSSRSRSSLWATSRRRWRPVVWAWSAVWRCLLGSAMAAGLRGSACLSLRASVSRQASGRRRSESSRLSLARRSRSLWWTGICAERRSSTFLATRRRRRTRRSLRARSSAVSASVTAAARRRRSAVEATRATRASFSAQASRATSTRRFSAEKPTTGTGAHRSGSGFSATAAVHSSGRTKSGRSRGPLMS
mmetsp:Transcript_16697/g.52218  ORF Transcript_16697/g.52218 Transcript_16697/m.52218 type:complete len:243 (-) Transcript_16697:525-1253(-)